MEGFGDKNVPGDRSQWDEKARRDQEEMKKQLEELRASREAELARMSEDQRRASEEDEKMRQGAAAKAGVLVKGWETFKPEVFLPTEAIIAGRPKAKPKALRKTPDSRPGSSSAGAELATTKPFLFGGFDIAPEAPAASIGGAGSLQGSMATNSPRRIHQPTLPSSVGEVVASNPGWEQEKAKLLKQIVDLKQEYNDKGERDRNTIATYENDLDKQNRLIKLNDTEIAELKEKLGNAGKNIEKLEGEMTELNQKIGSQTQQLAAKKDVHLAAQEDVRKQKDLFVDTAKKLSSVEAEYQKLAEGRDELLLARRQDKAEIQGLKHEQDLLKAKHEELVGAQGQFESLNAQIDRLTAQVASSREYIDTLNRQRYEARKARDAANAEAEELRAALNEGVRGSPSARKPARDLASELAMQVDSSTLDDDEHSLKEPLLDFSKTVVQATAPVIPPPPSAPQVTAAEPSRPSSSTLWGILQDSSPSPIHLSRSTVITTAATEPIVAPQPIRTVFKTQTRYVDRVVWKEHPVSTLFDNPVALVLAALVALLLALSIASISAAPQLGAAVATYRGSVFGESGGLLGGVGTGLASLVLGQEGAASMQWSWERWLEVEMGMLG